MWELVIYSGFEMKYMGQAASELDEFGDRSTGLWNYMCTSDCGHDALQSDTTIHQIFSLLGRYNFNVESKFFFIKETQNLISAHGTNKR